MAVLRCEDGTTYATYDAINERIAPTRIDPVPVPSGLQSVLGVHGLDDAHREQILAARDASLEAERVASGWPTPFVQEFWPGMSEDLETLLAGFAPPHTNPADEIHHVVEGAVCFGVVLDGGAQALAVLTPGDAIRLHEGTEHWSVLTEERTVTVVLYLSRAPGYAHDYTGTEVSIT